MHYFFLLVVFAVDFLVCLVGFVVVVFWLFLCSCVRLVCAVFGCLYILLLHFVYTTGENGHGEE
jgi:hypothetical protein